jgi:hypothetical protein
MAASKVSGARRAGRGRREVSTRTSTPRVGERQEQWGDAGDTVAHINGLNHLVSVPRQEARRQLASSEGRVFNGGQQVFAALRGAILAQQASRRDDDREEIAQVMNGFAMGASSDLEVRL